MKPGQRILKFLALIFLLNISAVKADEKLIFAASLIRHGDRTPFAEIKSPVITYNWPQGIGELTPIGMHQVFLLGREMRARYVDRFQLLPPVYQNGTVYALSTDLNRTIMSASCFLTGLYPPGTGPAMEDGNPALPFAFQPIPIHTIPSGQKNIINPTSESLEKHSLMLKKYAYNQKAWLEENLKFSADYPRWSRILGVEIMSLEDTLVPGDHINCMTIHEIPYPEGFTREDARKIIRARNRAAALRYLSREMTWFMTAGFFSRMMEDFNLAVGRRQPCRFILYSGHDDSLIAVMSCLNAPLDENPPYASHIDFELYRDDLLYRVKVRFNGKPVYLAPGNDKDSCSLEEFYEIIKPCIENGSGYGAIRVMNNVCQAGQKIPALCPS
jgi:acid phosphatase